VKECVYDKTGEQIHCCECLGFVFEPDELVMKALRKEGKLCGHVWMCRKCAGQIAALDAEFSPIYKTTTQPVVAA